jgi:hypothetical protein
LFSSTFVFSDSKLPPPQWATEGAIGYSKVANKNIAANRRFKI